MGSPRPPARRPRLQRPRQRPGARDCRAGGVEIRYYAVIYDLIDEVKGQCPASSADPDREYPRPRRNPRGLLHPQARQGRRLPRYRGLHPRRPVRLIRDNVIVYDGSCRRSSASRTTCAKSAPAWNAAWRSRATGHAPGRRDRVLRDRGGRAHAVIDHPAPAFAANEHVAWRDPSQRHQGKARERQLRVGETIRHALADIFSRGDIVDEVLSQYSLTVPEVRMTPDLKLATAFIFRSVARAPTRRSSISTSTSASCAAGWRGASA